MSDTPVAVNRPRAGWILWVGVLALIGMILILTITRLGPGASGDSAYYVMGAQNMIEGNGFSRTSGGGETKPITGFPPVFSAVLAALGLAGGDLLQVGRFLNAGLFAVNIFLAGGLVHRYTRSLWPTLLACAALLAADNLVGWHAWVMSEPLYLCLMLVGILGIANYIEEGHFLILVGTGLSLAAATLTRYVGVAQLPAFALSILFLSERNWLRRFFDCVLLSMVSLIPVFLWLRWNVAVAGTSVITRDAAVEPIDDYEFRFEVVVGGTIGTDYDILVARSTDNGARRSVEMDVLFYLAILFAIIIFLELIFDVGPYDFGQLTLGSGESFHHSRFHPSLFRASLGSRELCLEVGI